MPNYIPRTMNIELTTKCPLRCPQCYCSLTGGKDIDPRTAIYWLKEGAAMGVKDVQLSGGETLCYPHLYEVIRAAADCGMCVNVALSGVGFDQSVYDKLLESGVGGIFISLNGSTKETNSLTRDGYDAAIEALELLQENHYQNTVINWVMHSNNADDFPNVVALAKRYEVSSVVILGAKPDSRHDLHTIPSREQMKAVSQYVRTQSGQPRIYIESCFSPMLALTSDTKLFGNMNVGPNKGCGAGLSAFNVSVDGLLSPCRHLEYFEKYDTLEEYWENSATLKRLRAMAGETPAEPCSKCRFMNYCRPCRAINSKLENQLSPGNPYCTICEAEPLEKAAE